MAEDQSTISAWAHSIFGPPRSAFQVALRMQEEVDELMDALAAGDTLEAATEAADVLIVLFQVAEQLGVDLLEEVNRKMQINRAREWQTDGDGCGRHK